MAVLSIELGLDENQTHMFQDIFKYIVLLSIFHTLTSMAGVKNFGFNNAKLFNDNFISFLLILGISFMAYYLVILELIEII